MDRTDLNFYLTSKWVSTVASIWIQCSSGSLYTFSIYSQTLKSTQHYDQSTLDIISVSKDIGANVGVLSGLLYDFLASRTTATGPWLVHFLGSAQCFLGYFLMWAAVAGLLPPVPVPLMCLFMFVAAQAQSYFNTSNVVTGVHNFPNYSGTIVGIMKGFLGLSGAILIQVYRTIFNNKPMSYLLILAVLPPINTLILMWFVRIHNTHELEERKYLNIFSLMALVVAAYLMVVIILENILTLELLVRIFTFAVLIALLASLLCIAFKAHERSSNSSSESFLDEGSQLIVEPKMDAREDSSNNPLPDTTNNQRTLQQGQNLNLFQALQTMNFWILFVSMACGMGSGLATVNNMSQIGESLGYSADETGSLVALWSIWNFLGRFGAGYVSDYFLHTRGCARPFFMVITLMIMSIGYVVIAYGLPGALYVGSILVGICYGSQWSLMPTITSEFSASDAVCHNSTEEARLQTHQELNITDLKCASLFKSILCTAISDQQFSAKFSKIASDINRTVSILCNNTLSVKSQQSSGGCSLDICTRALWETCGNISIVNSLFESFLQDKAGKEHGFCETFGGYSKEGKAGFQGEPISLNNEQKTSLPPKGLCLEKISDGSYIDMAPHPDGSNRAFFANMQGKIWLAKIPVEGSNEILGIDESKTFLDISDNVLFDSGHGLMSIAFHPNFSQNGRFFLSYNCDQIKNPTCSGRCACNSDVNCDPSKIGSDHGIFPCQYHCVVAEFTVNGTSSKPSLAERANPLEVRRIFTIGSPHIGGHAGQILFGPADGYLYLMMSDGSNCDDPYNFAQNKRSLLGKILRIDVDRVPSTKEIDDMDLWGNYSIPRDNPYINDKELEPEIWAIGFKNAWRCSFDSERPSYFLCGDAGQDEYEEIDVIKKGKNYGWRVYEGPFLFHPSESPGGNTSASSIHPIFPVFGYSHSENDEKSDSASIIGGYFYRSMTDPCIYGRYLYTDMYTGSVLVGTESPAKSGNFTSAKISSRCAHDSPMPCSFVQGSATPSLGYVFSLAEDNKKDIYYLTSTGVYRVARPSRCNYLCTKEKVVGLRNNLTHYSSSSPLCEGFDFLLFLFFTIHFIL